MMDENKERVLIESDREKLIKCIEDVVNAEEAAKISDDYEFVEYLAWELKIVFGDLIIGKRRIEEFGKNNVDEFYSEKVANIIQLLEDPSSDNQLSFACAYFLLIAEILTNAELYPSILVALDKTTEKYPEDYKLQYLFAFSLSIAKAYNRASDVYLKTDDSEIKTKSIKKDPESIIRIFKTYIIINRKYFEQYPSFREYAYNFFKNIYPGVKPESFHDAIASVNLGVLADYYAMTNQEVELIKTVNESLSLWSNNSYSIALSAHLDQKKDDFEQSYEKLIKAERLIEHQFEGIPLKNKTLILIYLGFAFFFHKEKKLYKSSIEYSIKALELASEPLLKATILINRGRSLSENGDYSEAMDDFNESQKIVLSLKDLLNDKEKNLMLAKIHNNLGEVYYKINLIENAKMEFEEAIRLNVNLAEAHTNLGSVYANEGKKETAEKLFEAAYKLDRQSITTKANLEKIEAAKDLWQWWFGSSASSKKKLFGSILLFFLLFEVFIVNLMAYKGADTASLLGIIGVIVFILFHPMIKKLDFGSFKVELESKGESPLGKTP